MYTFGSLFAGAGGFDVGLEAAGWTPVFQVEIDKTADHSFTRHSHTPQNQQLTRVLSTFGSR